MHPLLIKGFPVEPRTATRDGGQGEGCERFGGINMTKQTNYLSCKDYREPNLSSISQSDLGILK